MKVGDSVVGENYTDELDEFPHVEVFRSDCCYLISYISCNCLLDFVIDIPLNFFRPLRTLTLKILSDFIFGGIQ